MQHLQKTGGWGVCFPFWRALRGHGDENSLSFQTLAHSFARSKNQLFCFQSIPHSLPQNTGGGGYPALPDFNLHSRSRKGTLVYNKLSGSISTSTAVSGISFASQYASAPLNNFVSTERFGDFSRNWNRCSFFKRASGAVAGPRMRTPLSSCGEKYSESCRDQRMAFSSLTSRTITFASDVNGGYAIIRRKCNSRSKNAP